MARQHRIQYPGAIYHVMARGDRREPIVRSDGDREAFLRTVGAMCERSGIRVYAYVLMDNHYHLVIETPLGNLVEGMRWLQNTYTRRVNVCHGLWGHVFGGRYRALPIDNQGEYFRRAIDYVHLNPCRAGKEDAREGLGRYPWSSLPLLLGPRGGRPDWLTADKIFAAHALLDTASGRRAYLEHLEKLMLDPDNTENSAEERRARSRRISFPATLRRGWYFGSDGFKESLLRLMERPGISKKNQENGYHGEQLRDRGEGYAQSLIKIGCGMLGLRAQDLLKRKANDPAKVMLAEWVAAHSCVRLDWLRAALHMGGRSHCSHLINGHRRALRTHRAFMVRRQQLDAALKIAQSND
jgi:putative transposase